MAHVSSPSPLFSLTLAQSRKKSRRSSPASRRDHSRDYDRSYDRDYAQGYNQRYNQGYNQGYAPGNYASSSSRSGFSSWAAQASRMPQSGTQWGNRGEFAGFRSARQLFLWIIPRLNRWIRGDRLLRLGTRLFRHIQVHKGLLIPIGIGLGLFLWQWQLMLALSAGIGAMILAYQIQRRDWQGLALGLRRWLQGPQQLLVCCGGSGLVAALGTYLVAAVWVESHDPWIASGFLFQGLGLFTLLVLVLVQWLSRQDERFETDLATTLSALVDPDPLKRLLAIRQIDRLISKSSLDGTQLKWVTAALQVLVKQESEAPVRNAALDSLQALKFQ